MKVEQEKYNRLADTKQTNRDREREREKKHPSMEPMSGCSVQ